MQWTKNLNHSTYAVLLGDWAGTDPEFFFREGINKNARVVNTFEKYLFIIVSNFILIY